ncbi:3'-5' exonuclease [Paraglaciecola sp. L3A3]|uniref:3'-5' exonuclease n=1 Tax=Paraglaciecola sp. L3A3 TaxID=2686358 RepID=UPI00131E77FA|nr:3'-5' exonuclease [Paraglaciecola sp. L3A3]
MASKAKLIWQKFNRWLRLQPHIPEQWQKMQLADMPFLCIDLELNSMKTADAQIVSIGWIEGKNNQIKLDSCFYQLVSTKAPLNQSPVFHGLTADDVAQGESVQTVLEKLKTYAQSHIWVFHCTNLDMTILRRVYNELGISLPTIVTVDTLTFGLYQLTRHKHPPPPNAVVLPVCRARYNLPAVPAHNALDDAMATLELLFAQIQKFSSGHPQTLENLLITKAVRVYSDKDKI